MEKKGKYVSESSINDQTAVVFPNDLNAYGTLFGGRVLELADRTAGVVAKRHSGRDCVTLGIDSVRFLAPAKHGEVLIFKAAINRVWRSSMEIGLKVIAEEYKTGESKHIFSAYFTFVAVDDSLKPVAIFPIIPVSQEELRRFEQAEMRRQRRIRADSSSV